MKQVPRESGFLLLDLIVGLALFGVLLFAIYRLYGPTFALARDINSRLFGQQDVRLAADRVARALHETSTAYGRLRSYSPEAGCNGAYQGCIGFVTARDNECSGAFQVVDGAPNWQATLYLWRDTGTNQLRLRCDATTTFPVSAWPPPTLEPFTVIGTNIVAATIGLAGGTGPSAVTLSVEEQGRPSAPGSPLTFFNETIFLPQNR